MSNFILRSISSIFLLALGAGIGTSELIKDIAACALFIASFYELKNLKSALSAFYSIVVLWGIQVMLITKHTTVFCFLMVAWAHDIGGYFFGKLLGGPKIAPHVSPNKTWAGFLGGWILIIPITFYFTSDIGMPKSYKIILAFLINTICLIGDLIESYVKRRAGVKDSGNLIPGHGGVLDRFDSFLFLMISIRSVSITLKILGHYYYGN
jgi:phosphatidate cytidylyltransferase